MIQMLATGLGSAFADLERTHLAGMGGTSALLSYRPSRFPLWLISILFFSVAMLGAAEDIVPITGFSSGAAARKNATELRYRALVLRRPNLEISPLSTTEPHPAGSPRNNELAQWVAAQWREQGLEDVTIHQYEVLNSSPRDISLEMIAPKKYRATLHEAPYEVDPDTKNQMFRAHTSATRLQVM